MQVNEVAAGHIHDLQNGSMKEIQSGEDKIILAKIDDRFYAVGGICPHLKAPLVKGALCGKRLYCPWHHSAFDVTSGSLCEPPALDGLPRYGVRVAEDQVYVSLTPMATGKEQAVTNKFADKVFVIAGAGAAGLMAAETLRSNGFGGKLVMITKETEPPYDRTLLSKKFLSGKTEPEALALREAAFYREHDILLETEKQIRKIDAATNSIHFKEGRTLPYDCLLVATGGTPNSLTIPGSTLPNVFTLRSQKDAEQLLEQASVSRKACVIGASFIGTETAASLKNLGLEVTLLAKESVLFEKNFGERVGRVFQELHQQKGVVVKNRAEVDRIEGEAGAEAVILASGERIEADLVIVGIGVHPETGFVQGVACDEKDGSILVDAQLKAAENLYAAGDIARFTDERTGKPVRIEHWRLAQQQGRIAALNMLGESHSVKELVPFFWTNQFDKRLSYVGHADDWDTVEIDGEPAKQDFMAFYLKAGKVQAVAAMGRDAASNRVEEAMRQSGTLLTVEELKKAISGC